MSVKFCSTLVRDRAPSSRHDGADRHWHLVSLSQEVELLCPDFLRFSCEKVGHVAREKPLRLQSFGIGVNCRDQSTGEVLLHFSVDVSVSQVVCTVLDVALPVLNYHTGPLVGLPDDDGLGLKFLQCNVLRFGEVRPVRLDRKMGDVVLQPFCPRGFLPERRELLGWRG